MMGGYKVTSQFDAIDAVRDGVPHTGIDLQMVTGTSLRSVVDGWVSKVWDGSGTLGKGVTVKGLDGREYIYGHMDLVTVKVGEAVKFGSFIGNSGNTGRSTGSHLHFAIRENGQYINPSSFKETLDKITGDNYMRGPSNSRESLEFLNCGKPSDSAWYDIQGNIQDKFDLAVCEQKQQFYAYLKALLETTVELSFSFALVGGGLLIILGVAGMTRAFKYFGVLQVSYILFRFLFGGTTR